MNETVVAGSHVVIWDGKDDKGAPAASGSYFYRIRAGASERTRKMLLLK